MAHHDVSRLHDRSYRSIATYVRRYILSMIIPISVISQHTQILSKANKSWGKSIRHIKLKLPMHVHKQEVQDEQHRKLASGCRANRHFLKRMIATGCTYVQLMVELAKRQFSITQTLSRLAMYTQQYVRSSIPLNFVTVSEIIQCTITTCPLLLDHPFISFVA